MSGQSRECIADAACLSAEKVLGLLQKGLALAPERSVLAAFTFPLDRETVHACLDHPSIAGVILNDAANAQPFDDPSRVGYRFGFNGSWWRFPSAASRTVIVLGKRELGGAADLVDSAAPRGDNDCLCRTRNGSGVAPRDGRDGAAKPLPSRARVVKSSTCGPGRVDERDLDQSQRLCA